MKKYMLFLSSMFLSLAVLTSCSNDDDVSKLEENYFSVKGATYAEGSFPKSTNGSVIEDMEVSSLAENGAASSIVIVTDKVYKKFFVGVKGVNGYWIYTPVINGTRSGDSEITYTIPVIYSSGLSSGMTMLVSAEDEEGDITEPYEAEINFVDKKSGDLLMSIGELVKFSYDENKRLTQVNMMEEGCLTFSYEPFSMKGSDETYSNFKFNDKGYLISFSAKSSDADSWTETIDYDKDGHIIRDEQHYADGFIDILTMTWKDGNLIKCTDTGFFNGEVEETETLTSQYGNIENKAKQMSYSQIMGSLRYTAYEATGVFGKTYSEKLPISVKDVYTYGDEEPEVETVTFSYEFNNDGTIAKETLNGYYSLNYQYGNGVRAIHSKSGFNMPYKTRRNIKKTVLVGIRRH